MFVIISDSACDLCPDYVAKHNVEIVPIYVSLDGENYLKSNIDITNEEVYEKTVNEAAIPKTSLPSVQDYIDKFMPHVENNEAVICTTISTSLSGSFNSASTAKDIILEDYPDAKIEVINSTTNTVTQGLFVNELVRMRDAGLSFEECIDKARRLTDSTRIFFTVATLDYLIKNGRIGSIANVITNKIKIKPIIVMKDNEIGLGGIARTRANSVEASLKACQKYFKEHKISDYNFVIGWGYNKEEAYAFADHVAEELGCELNKETGSLIGIASLCHTGPHALGIGCVRKYETL